MARLGMVRPVKMGSEVRGGGLYAERLYEALQKIDGLSVSWENLSFWPSVYRRFDLVHFPYFDLFFPTFPPVRLAKTVVTLHDLIPLRFPGHFPLGKRAKIVWPIQRALVKMTEAVITDSQAAKKDIIALVGYPSEKIYVVPLAADGKFKKISDRFALDGIKEKYKLAKEFVLYVGGVNWNKNLPTLIRACGEVRVSLVIVGQEALGIGADFTHIENQPLAEIISLCQGNALVERLGYVPTEDLVAIYNLATVYAQPSVYEGFGLPVLEALACGTVVVCGRNSSLVEVGGEAAVYADVTDVSDLGREIQKVLRLSKSSREKIVEKGRRRAAEFSWERTAKETYEVYREVLARS